MIRIIPYHQMIESLRGVFFSDSWIIANRLKVINGKAC